MFSTMKGEPCAPKAQVGALFSEFLSLSEPCSDLLLSDSSDTIITSTPSSPLPLMLSVQGPSSRTTATDMRSDQSKPPPKRKVGGFPDTGLKKKRVKKDDAVVEQACADVDASKKARRRKQNRVAAQTSREKKKKYLTNLEDKVHALTQQNQDLQAQLQAMQEENMRLKQAQAMEFSCAKTEDVIQGVDPIITDVVVKTESVESCFSTDPEQTWQQSATTCETAVFSFPQQSGVVALSCLVCLWARLATILPTVLKALLIFFYRRDPASLTPYPVKSPAKTPTTCLSCAVPTRHPSCFQLLDIARRKPYSLPAA